MKGFALEGVGAPVGGTIVDFDFDLKPVLAHYESQAPASLPPPEPWPAPGDDPARFVRRTLERGGRHASLDVADYDGDGDVDLAVGSFQGKGDVALEVWENRGRPVPTPARSAAAPR